MNPDVSSRRGCFIRKEENKTFTVVDYPTWSFKKYGYFIDRQNEPLPESVPAEVNFQTREEALKFCTDENLVVCAGPHDGVTEYEPDPDPVQDVDYSAYQDEEQF